MLESTSGTCPFEAPTIFWWLPAWSSELETGIPFFSELPRVEFRVEFGTGNRHVPFFRSCPAWSSPQSWAAGRLCRAGMWRAGRWASPYSLGESRLGRAIKRGWGEPSNEVGRASTKGAVGRATQLSQPPRLLQLGAVPRVPARHV